MGILGEAGTGPGGLCQVDSSQDLVLVVVR